MQNRIKSMQEKYKTEISTVVVPSDLLEKYGALYFIRAVNGGFVTLFRRSGVMESNIVFLSKDMSVDKLLLRENSYIVTIDVDNRSAQIFYAVANINDLPSDKNKALHDKDNGIKVMNFDGSENKIFISSYEDSLIFPTYLCVTKENLYFYDYASHNVFVYDLVGNLVRKILLENQYICEITVDANNDKVYCLSFSDINTGGITTGCDYRRIYEIAADDTVGVFYEESITNNTFSVFSTGNHVYISDVRFLYKFSVDKDIIFRGEVRDLLSFNGVNIDSPSLWRFTPSVSDKNIFYGIVYSKGTYFVATMTV